MRRIVDSESPKPEAEVLPSDINLEDLLGKTRVILYREIRNLMVESASGLLSKDSSQSLISYVKLLKDIHKEDKHEAESLSIEELEKIAKNETKSSSSR